MKKWLGLALLCTSGAAQAYMGTISFYGDSFVFRSQWLCEGRNLTTAECEQLKVDSSYATYVPQPYSWNTEPVFEVVHAARNGGEPACHGPAARGWAAGCSTAASGGSR